MNERFRSLVIRDWQTRLVHNHPRVFPDACLVHTPDGPALSCSGWPSIPEGWRAIVETACRRLAEAVASEPEAEFVLIDMKEKYGMLCLAASSFGLSEEANAAVTLALDLAEARSAHVCDVCGRPGRLSEQGGWYATRCEEHLDEFVPVRARNPDLQITTHLVDGRQVRTARHYSFATDSFVAAAVPHDEE